MKGGGTVRPTWPWTRQPDVPISQVPLTGAASLHHPRDGILKVQRGQTSYGTPVYVTTDEPRRWFVVFRGVTTDEGVYALILWEVDPNVGQRALWKRETGKADAAPVIVGMMDVNIPDDPAGLL